MSIPVFCTFLNWISFHCYSVRVLHIIWTLDPYQKHDLQILSPILMIVFFTFLRESFMAKKFLILSKSILTILWLLVFLEFYLINHCLIQGHEDLCLCFLTSFITLGLICRS